MRVWLIQRDIIQMQRLNQFPHYAQLVRLDKPIGILLLLWPTMWALWLANDGMPSWPLLIIFGLGTVVMRSLGCILNDIADRHIDGHVKRTESRPLVSGKVSLRAALILAGCLALMAFVLVLQLNRLTIGLAFVGLLLAAIYPYLKRVTHLPQVGLGLAFSWSVPMAFAASLGYVPLDAWYLFATAAIWPVIYDTMYAMVDRYDDMRIGVKSSAILFAERDCMIVLILQIIFVVMLGLLGWVFELEMPYFYCLIFVIGLFAYQQALIRTRKAVDCFAAFTNNHYVGLMVFVGILWGQY